MQNSFAIIVLILALAAQAFAEITHHYRFDETAGPTAANSAGHVDGRLRNAADFQPDQGLNGALRCDNDDDGVALGEIDLGQSFTIMGWSKPVTQSPEWRRFVNSSHMIGCYLGFKPSGTENRWSLLIQLAGPNGANITGPPVNYNAWQHVAATYDYDARRATLYVNAVPFGPVNCSPPAAPLFPVYVGKDKTASPAIRGLYDDLAICNTALTQAEIHSIYQQGLAGHPLQPYQPTNPSPPDNALDVPLDATLAWSPPTNPPSPLAGYHLFYGPDPGDVFNSRHDNLTGRTTLAIVDPDNSTHTPGLPGESAIYWRVDAVFASETIARGPLWQLETHSRKPVITRQPVDTHARIGDAASLSIAVSSELPGHTFQWYRNGEPLADSPGRIEGANTDTVTIYDITPDDAGRYHALAANPAGGVESELAYLILAQTFCNPIDVKAADIFIDRFDGTYYMYATSSIKYTFPGKGCPIWTSPDLINWRLQGLTYPPHATTWAQYWFWGAECHRKNDRYYLYHTGFRKIDGQDVGRLSVAVADSPAGPFREIKAPLFDWDPGADVIAPSVFTDDDGSRYIYWTATSNLGNVMYGARLADDMMTLASTPVLCIQPSQEWEGRITEGTKVLRHNDLYYFTYSGDHFLYDYALGYATGPTPLGPWTKHPDNPIMKGTPEVQKPGSHCFVESPDGRDMFVAYHSMLQPPGHVRQLNLSRVHFVDDPAGGPDILVVERPATKTPQPYPSGVPFTRTAVSDEFDGPFDFGVWNDIWSQSVLEYTTSGGRLVLELGRGCVREERADGCDVLLQLAPEGDWNTSMGVTLDARENGEGAFLTVWQDSDNYLMLSSNYRNRKNLEVGVERGGVYQAVLQAPNLVGDSIHLQIRRTGATGGGGPAVYRCYYSSDKELWNPLGPAIELGLDDMHVGLGAWREDAGRTGVSAYFDYFYVERTSPAADVTGDGIVDSEDLAGLVAQWLGASTVIRAGADFTSDGRVDGYDFGVLQREW